MKTIVSSFARRCIIDTMMLLCYIGIGSVYIIFMANNMHQCLHIDDEKFVVQIYYTLILFPFLFLINIVKNLADIAPISVAGNILLVLAGIIGIVYALKDGIGDTWVTIQPRVDLYPKFAGMVFFSMCSPGLVSSSNRITYNFRDQDWIQSPFKVHRAVLLDRARSRSMPISRRQRWPQR